VNGAAGTGAVVCPVSCVDNTSDAAAGEAGVCLNATASTFLPTAAGSAGGSGGAGGAGGGGAGGFSFSLVQGPGALVNVSSGAILSHGTAGSGKGGAPDGKAGDRWP
jgi:hypothetical protein